MIALYLEHGAFGAGREEEEAAALWATVRAKAARRTAPFDPAWFADLPRQAGHGSPAAPATIVATASWQDWGEAPAVPVVQGRGEEMATLARWVRDEGCHVVQVLGAGGIGKTTLTVQLAHDLGPTVATVYWRSLRNALPVEEWLAGAIAALAAEQAAIPERFDAQLGLLVELLRAQRALLVLDNLEAILEPGAPIVRYRAGHEGYGAVLARLAEGAHRSCLLLTSREQPLLVDAGLVRALRLDGLDVEAGRALLARRALTGDDAGWQALVARYAGNPLALHMVGETISRVFGGDIAAFLTQDVAVFGDIRQLLDEQMGRLSAPEQAVVSWLAMEREPVGFAELAAALGPGVARPDALEAVEALRRRSLLEWGPGGAFMLQPVVLEYATTRLVTSLAQEILAGAPARLVGQPLLQATAKDYVRRSQERLIAEPVLERLRGALGGDDAVERRLLHLLGTWRGQAEPAQGYGPGNVVNLLRLLRGHLRGLDLSRLVMRQAYLQGIDLQDASLAHALVSGAVLGEAFGAVSTIALSADGRYIAGGMVGGDVRVWRVTDHLPILSVQGHAAGVWAVALSATGRLVASGGLDGAIQLWEVESGRRLSTLHGHAGGVRAVAFVADGRLLVSGGEDGTVRLWELPSGHPLARLHGHAGIWSVAVDGAGRLLASGGEDGTVQLWELPGGRPLATLQGHTAAVWSVAVVADGQLVASGSFDGLVCLWEVNSGRLLATLPGHAAGVRDVVFAADGRLLASGGLDGTIRLWQTPGGRLLATLQGHAAGVRGVAFAPHGRLLASGGEDGLVRLWEADSGRLLATLRGHAGGVRGVAFAPDGRLLASGSFDSTVRLWETPSGRSLAVLASHSAGVWDVAFSAEARLLASGGEDGTVRLWEVDTGRLVATLQGHPAGVYSVAFDGAGRLLASGGLDGAVRLWEIPGGQLLATLQGHRAAVRGVAFAPHGRLLASGGYDGTVRLWQTPAGHPLATLRGHAAGVYGVAIDGAGHLLASSSADGTIKL